MIVPIVSLSMKLIYTQIKFSNVNEIKKKKKIYMSEKVLGGISSLRLKNQKLKKKR